MVESGMIETSTPHQEWFRINPAARRAGVSPRTVRRWIDKGLPAYRVAEFLLINRTELDDWIRSHAEAGMTLRPIVRREHDRG